MTHMAETLAVHVFVTPVVQTALAVDAVYLDVTRTAEPVVCEALLTRIRDVVPSGVLHDAVDAALRTVVYSTKTGTLRVAASTHPIPGAVYVLLSHVTEHEPDTVEITVRKQGGWRTARVPIETEPRDRLQCAAPLPAELADNLVPERLENGTYAWRVKTPRLSGLSTDALAWLQDAFFAVAVMCNITSGAPAAALCTADSLDELMTRLREFDAQRMWPVMLNGTKPPLGWLLQHEPEVVLRILRGDLTDTRPRLVRVCGYGAVPAGLSAANLVEPISYSEATGRFTALLLTAPGEGDESVLRRCFPEAPPEWPWRAVVGSGIAELTWEALTPETCPTDDTTLARYLPFWRRTTPCILTYLMPFRVVIQPCTCLVGAAAALLETFTSDPRPRFWGADTSDLIHPALSPDALLRRLCTA